MAEGATDEEAARARAQLKASLLMALESPHARCEQIATHLLAFGHVIPVPELMARINAVDTGVLRRFARDVCLRGSPAIAAVGPVQKLEHRERFARRFDRGQE
jgi:predicted Zn-dependent peptidase